MSALDAADGAEFHGAVLRLVVAKNATVKKLPSAS